MKRPDYGDATPEDVAQALMQSRNVRLKKDRSNRPDPGPDPDTSDASKPSGSTAKRSTEAQTRQS